MPPLYALYIFSVGSLSSGKRARQEGHNTSPNTASESVQEVPGDFKWCLQEYLQLFHDMSWIPGVGTGQPLLSEVLPNNSEQEGVHLL